MSRPSSIFFATIAAGGGHVATARAMAESVEELSQGRVTARVSDVMAEFGPQRMDAQHKSTWRWMLRYPRTVRSGQRIIDAVPGAVVAWQRVFLDDFARRLATTLGELAPDLVVGNHGWLATALTRAQRRYGLRTPVLSYLTEPLDANALWAEPRVERALAASRAARDDLVRLGVPDTLIDIVGYPVQRRFRHAPERADARRGLGLEPRFTCLVSLGAEGVAGNPADVVGALAGTGAQTVIIAGRNLRLARELEAAAAGTTGVHVRGFVEDMERYVAAADVFVGKAGPASVMETLAVGRPLLLTAYAGLNERRVAEFVESRGLGKLVPRARDIAVEVMRLQQDAGLRLDIEARIGALGFDRMADGIGRYLLHYAESREPPAPLGTWELA
ncbi:MAG TPA: glycosyltransferase [Trueperaceae bacterium]|nr:glycosyltransferase [Trueperaceae bacterium]